MIRNQIYLSALLHDIGKFYQRADTGKVSTSKHLKQGVKNLETQYCPPYKGTYTHKHVLWTAQFFADFESTFRRLTPVAENPFFTLASKHHNPSTIAEKIITLADHYSSGIDRVEEKHENSLQNQQHWDSFRKLRMVSIFEFLLWADKDDKTDKFDYQYALPIQKLEARESFFPKKADNFSQTAEQEYATLWEEFRKEFSKIQNTDIKAFSTTVLNLLNKYTVNVPGSTQHLRDVSLYDHAKSTAAFALCLYDYLEEKNKLTEVKIEKDDKPILFVGADLSGIQKFIYDIVSKNATKNLKGRSFYLQLLVDNILKYILDHLNLTVANVVYSSGGGFYLLAPNTQAVKTKLNEIEKNITQQLFGEHKLSLFLAIESQEISQGEIFEKKISKCWETLAEKLNAKKRNRFSHLLVERYDDFFSPIEQGGRSLRDAITYEEFETGEQKIPFNPNQTKAEVTEPEYVKAVTDMQMRLGKQLKETDYWIVSPKPLRFFDAENQFQVCQLQYVNYFVSEKIVKSKIADIKAIAHEIEIYKFNQTDFLNAELAVNKIALAYSFYGGNNFPVNPQTGDIKTFDQLAEDNSQSPLKRLGVLRMDVDNLGLAFGKGFAENRATFSRYSALSRSLDFYFKAYLNHLWESKPEYKENTYIVYAGGDDLFIVGKWDVLSQMAKSIQSNFENWVCHNTKLSISGGIAIVTPKFPIIKAAEIAGKMEKKAKNYQFPKISAKADNEHLQASAKADLEACSLSPVAPTIEKNAFCIFDYPLHWQNELPIVLKMKDELKFRIEGKDISRAILGKIKIFSYMQHSHSKNQRWRWLMAYDFARFIQNKRKNSTAREFLDNIKNSCFSNTYEGKTLSQFSNYHFITLLAIAARWAEMELRK